MCHPVTRRVAQESVEPVARAQIASWTVSVSTPNRSDLLTLAFTYAAVGVTVSVALVDRGVSTGVILAASFFMFSATSELAFLAVDDAGGSLAAAVASGWLVATRFGLLATSLTRVFEASRLERIVAAISSLDPNVALAVQQPTADGVRQVFWHTTAALMGGFWIGSIAGLVLGNVMGDTTQWGLDVVFPAALLSIIGSLLRRREGLLAAVVGAVTCLGLVPFAPGGTPILASSLGAIVGALAIGRRRSTTPNGPPDGAIS